MTSATRALLETVRWSAPPAPIDWAGVEKAVGVRYPTEFREVADALPPGNFQTFLSLLHPAEHKPKAYAKEVRGYAEMFRPHRVLPWAVVGMDYVIGWLVEGDDPDEWPVVVGDGHSSELHTYRMSTAEFLRAVLTVPSPVEPLAFVAEAEQPPTFYASDGTTSDDPGRASWSPATAVPLAEPTDAVDRLSELVTPVPVEHPDWYEVWMKVQGKLGWPPPEDYQHLAEKLGAITVGPVTVAVPGGPVDLLKTYEKMRRQVTRERAAGGGPAGAVWPEPGGILRWADLAGGGHVCWLAISEDPGEWPVLVVDADLSHPVLHQMSASRFLLEVATNPEHPWGG